MCLTCASNWSAGLHCVPEVAFSPTALHVPQSKSNATIVIAPLEAFKMQSMTRPTVGNIFNHTDCRQVLIEFDECIIYL